MTAPRGYQTVEPPQRRPNRYGLFSVAQLRDVPAPDPVAGGGHELMGVQWSPHACEHPGLWPHECGLGGEGDVVPGEKCVTCQPQPNTSADPITVYGSWHCPLVGFSVAEAQERAREHLTAGEQHALEFAIWTGAMGNRPAFAVGEDDPHGGQPTPVLGYAACGAELLSLIYAAADVGFAGEPVIHVPRAALPWLARENLVVRASGGRLETPAGVPIVAGTGYTEANTGPDGVQAPQGSWWVYVTGPVVVYRGPIVDVPEPPGTGLNTRTNDYTALAERRFVVAWDCLTAAVQFTPSCGGGA